MARRNALIDGGGDFDMTPVAGTSTTATTATTATGPTMVQKFGIIEALLFDPKYGKPNQKGGIWEVFDVDTNQKNPGKAADLWVNTDWYKLNENAKSRYLLNLEKKPVYLEQRNAWLINIKRQLASQNITTDDATLFDYYDRGITNEVIVDELIGTQDGAGGFGATNRQLLAKAALDNGLNLERDFAGEVDGWLQRIARGESPANFLQTIRDRAAANKPKYVQDQLKLGKNLREIYGSLVDKIASTFDLAVESFDLNDPIFSKLFTDKGPVDNRTLINTVQKDPRFTGSITGEKRQSDIDLTKIEVEKAARDNGIDFATVYPEGLDSVVSKIVDGLLDVRKVVQDIRTRAATGRPKYVQDQLKSGRNLRDVYASYIANMASEFGIDAGVIDINDPLLQKAFTDKGPVNTFEFQNLIRNDERFKGTAGAVSDAQVRQNIIDTAVRMGVNLNDADVADITSQAVSKNLNAASPEIAALIRSKMTYQPGQALTGQAGDVLAELRQTAAENGINLDQAFGSSIQDWVQKIAQGESVDTYKRLIREAAKMGLPDNVKKLLDQGMNLSAIYQPYRSYMSNILEIPLDSIDINDSLLRSAIGPDKEMTMYDWQRTLRKDPRWQYTDRARQEVSDSVLGVLRDFGFQG